MPLAKSETWEYEDREFYVFNIASQTCAPIPVYMFRLPVGSITMTTYPIKVLHRDEDNTLRFGKFFAEWEWQDSYTRKKLKESRWESDKKAYDIFKRMLKEVLPYNIEDE